MQNWMGIHTRCGHTYYSSLLKPESTVIDLGANRGHFSYALSKEHGCQCFAVEPHPVLFQQIDEREGLKKFNFAISECDGPIDFFPSENIEAGTIRKSGSSMGYQPVSISGVCFSTFLRQEHITVTELLKVDIEGAEVELFRSVSDEALKDIEQITIEFHDFIEQFKMSEEMQRIIQRLKSLDFLYINFIGNHNHQDCLFVNCKKVHLPIHVYIYLLILKRIFSIRSFFIRIFRKSRW